MGRAGPRVNPWRTIWLTPRATVRTVAERTPAPVVLLLAALGGMAQVLDRASAGHAGDTLSLGTILLLTLLAGPVIGVAALHVASILIRWTGRCIGGAAQASHIRTAFAWANVPVVLALGLWIPALLLFREELFTSAMPRVESSLGLAVAMVAFGAMTILLSVWALVVLVKGVAEVQRFSSWRALANVALAAAVVAAPVALVVAIALVSGG